MQYSVGAENAYATGIPGVDDQDMRKAFRTIDLDKDGQISGRDLRTFLEALGEKPSDTEITEMIRMADTGRDGTVHLSEFFELFKSITTEGYPNEVYEEVVKLMSSMRVDQTDTNESNEDILKLYVSRLPGAVNGISFITKDFLKEVINRWKQLRITDVTEKDFLILSKISRGEIGSKAFKICTNGQPSMDIKSFILVLGAFVAAPVDERVDFACRLVDDTGAGMLSEEQVLHIFQSNFIGIKTDLKSRITRVMKDSDSNGLVSRKQLSFLAKYEPELFFPTGRIDFIVK